MDISFHELAANYAAPHQYANGFNSTPASDQLIQKIITKLVWSPVIFDRGERRQSNFKYSDLCALDFDNPETTLAEAVERYQNFWCIIGVTKSHQKEKNGIKCDRFRVITKWEVRIDDLATYHTNIRLLARGAGADMSATDGARFFYPCTKIVFTNLDPDGFCETVKLAEKELQIKPLSRFEILTIRRSWLTRKTTGRRHIDSFLRDGIPFGSGRNQSCYVTAIFLLQLGYTADQVKVIIDSSPFDRTDFMDREISSAIQSASKKVQALGRSRA